MSTFHPATSSLANFKNTILTISTSRFFIYISARQEPMFVMASQFELFLPANSYTSHLLSSTCATNEGITVLEVWSFFPFAIKRILGIKRICPCSFANKRMRLLTHVYSSYTLLVPEHPFSTVTVTSVKCACIYAATGMLYTAYPASAFHSASVGGGAAWYWHVTHMP